MTLYTRGYFLILASRGASELRKESPTMVYIVKTTWAGLQGGPGITQMALEANPPGGFMDAATAGDITDAVRTFWQALVSQLPNEVSLTVQPTIDSFVTATGELGPSITGDTVPAVVTGLNTNTYNAAGGYRIRILTDGIKNNRRVRGAIFVVPVGGDQYNNAGSVDSFTISTVNTAQANLRTTLAGLNYDLGVWSRPVGTPPGTGGSFYPTTGLVVSSKAAVLRGRRG